MQASKLIRLLRHLDAREWKGPGKIPAIALS